MRRLVAIIVAGACLSLGPSALVGPAAAAGGDKIFGIHEPNTVAGAPGYPSEEGLAFLLTDLGAKGHRWAIDWKTVEPQAPQNGVHSYRFASTDRLYAADIARGIKPLIYVLNAPKWAWGSEVPTNSQPYGIPPGADHLDDWRAFVAAAARRYPQAGGFEIWNEPDAWGWTRGVLPIDPVAYTRVLASAYDAVKSENPSIPVVGGAIATYPTTVAGVHMSVNGFVGGMLRAGAANYMDAISMHAYAVGPIAPDFKAYRTPVNWVREVLANNGVSMPIWITEAGTTTTGATAVTEQGQAQTLVSLYQWFQTQPDLKALFIHSLFERWTNPLDRQVGFGLIPQGVGAQPKPAFYALRDAIGPPPTTGPPPAGGAPIATAPTAGSSETSTQTGTPTLNLDASIPATQGVTRSRGLRVNVDCHGPCSVKAQGSLMVRMRGARTTSYRFRTTSSHAPGPLTMKLELQRGSRKALRPAGRTRGRLRARVTVVAHGPGGVTATRTLSASLKH